MYNKNKNELVGGQIVSNPLNPSNGYHEEISSNHIAMHFLFTEITIKV